MEITLRSRPPSASVGGAITSLNVRANLLQKEF
jgi:hypothetical protein